MMNTMKILSVVGFILIFMSAQDVSALVLFDQPLSNSNGAVYSNLGGQEGKDDFTLSSDAFITGITWYGYHNGYDFPLSDTPLDFILRFSEDNAGSPGSIIFEQDVSAQVQSTGQLVTYYVSTGQTIFQYMYDALPSIPIAAGETTWVSVIENDSRTDPVGATQWKWSYSTSASANNAFTLEGRVDNTIPEPSTMLLLGIGLIGLAGIRKWMNN